MFIGTILFITGLAFLLKNLGILSGVTWSFIWPVVIMLIGLSMIINKKKLV
ncbi:MAG TPA: DUF5668 domain-containing protein [bacterium]|nr:DUF5668 domain-containing protein [bacterium]